MVRFGDAAASRFSLLHSLETNYDTFIVVRVFTLFAESQVLGDRIAQVQCFLTLG